MHWTWQIGLGSLLGTLVGAVLSYGILSVPTWLWFLNRWWERRKVANPWVSFSDTFVPMLGEQVQYLVRYVTGMRGEYPALGNGLRFRGDPGDYHELCIHRDDVEKFAARYNNHMAPRTYRDAK